jgi:hypothetical protein
MSRRNEVSLFISAGILFTLFVILIDAFRFFFEEDTFSIDRYLHDEIAGTRIARIDLLIRLLFPAILVLGIYMIVITRDFWYKKLKRLGQPKRFAQAEADLEAEADLTIAIGSLLTLLFLFIDLYLFFWQKKLWEPLDFLNNMVPLIDWKLMDITHVLLWLAILFFGMIAYANLREKMEAPAGWLDFGAIIPIIAVLLVLVYNEWITLLFLILSGLEPFYFYAAIGKSESANLPKKAKKDTDGRIK